MTPQDKRAIPGGLSTALGFTPWIIYWVLAGMGHTTPAILFGLAVSLGINGYRLVNCKVKIMDAVSLIFLAIAAFVTLLLRSDVLVFYGGVLSDTTLALMAWGSLLLGNPFTYDYAKEDWDESFWDDPLFVKTNQIVTAVWGVVFTVQALSGATSMAMGLDGVARIALVAIVPRALLLGGIAFSAWFPHWYPPRVLAQQRPSNINTTGVPEEMTGLQLIEAMPLAFDAQAAGGLAATLQFILEGEGGGLCYLSLEEGRCSYHPGQVPQPTLTIESPVAVWDAIARGEMDGAEAFMNSSYRAEGDMSLLIQLNTLFGAG
ncbi:MAG TPA: SCP2 sterol-binding domain-containing protein [Chloroflexi bacterium]|nr:SCP2 sterol-binding domain-containing protein [Chloroflexota bacterium]